jgi:cytokinesis protein
MESAGLRRILDKIRAFSHPVLDRQLESYDSQAQSDLLELQDSLAHDELEDLQDPYEVLRAVLLNVEGTRGQDFLISALKHLLLIRQEGEKKVRYFQLVDRIITAVVMDNKALDADFATVLGTSVANVIERFSDQDRLQKALDEAATFKAHADRLNLEKVELEDQISQQQGGLVHQLKSTVARTEEDLRISRSATESLETRLESTERAHREKEAELELQVRELFNMLKEARMLEVVEGDSGVLDRRELMEQMEKKLQRTKTIHALEGRTASKVPDKKPAAVPPPLPRDTLQVDTGAANQITDSASPRKSRFEDAEDDTVRLHIEQSLAANAASLVRSLPAKSVTLTVSRHRTSSALRRRRALGIAASSRPRDLARASPRGRIRLTNTSKT